MPNSNPKPLATHRLQHRILPPVTPVPDRSVPEQAVPATPPIEHPDAPVVAASSTRQQTALSVTREIQKNLVIMKKAFLRVVVLLGQVRDEKLYTELGHATIEAYAKAQLGLKRSALSKYLRVYDGLRQSHPAWLKPGAKVKLADLDDADGLIWIEKQLERKNLPATDKTALQGLGKKAREGTLLRSELRAYKAHGDKIAHGKKTAGGNRAFLSKLRRLREYGARLAGLPEGVIAHLEAAIGLLKNDGAEPPKLVPKKNEKRLMAGK